MGLPTLTFQIINPGSAARRAATDQVPIYFGVAESGDLATIKTWGNPAEAAAHYTRGHLLDQIRHAFACGAKEVHSGRLNAAVAGSLGTQVATGSPDMTLTLGGTYSSRYRIKVEILTAGGEGEATFRYALDFFEITNVDPTWSEAVLIPAAAAYTIPGTAITLTFDDTGGDAVVGDAWVQDVYPGHYSATEVAALADVVRGDQCPPAATVLVFCGEPPPGVSNAGAATANTIIVAVNSLIASLFATADFFGAMVGCSEASAASVITATADTVATVPLVSAGYSRAFATNPVAQPGRAIMSLPECEAVMGARIAGSLISSDPARTASGALPRIIATNYDARLQGGTLEAARISTLRTYQKRLSPGVFVARQRLLDSPVGNFYSWQDAALMIAALRAVHPVAWLMIADGFRANADGTMDEIEAVAVDSAATRALGAVLLQPTNARGVQGHVTDAIAVASRTTVLPSVRVDITISRLGYAEDITFALQYGGGV